jgi:hypothetical protein
MVLMNLISEEEQPSKLAADEGDLTRTVRTACTRLPVKSAGQGSTEFQVRKPSSKHYSSSRKSV